MAGIYFAAPHIKGRNRMGRITDRQESRERLFLKICAE